MWHASFPNRVNICQTGDLKLRGTQGGMTCVYYVNRLSHYGLYLCRGNKNIERDVVGFEDVLGHLFWIVLYLIGARFRWNDGAILKGFLSIYVVFLNLLMKWV